jgi:nucleoside 2-deoxyribosyltransferase
MLMPARLGSHVELGIALALCKPVIIITNGEDFEKKSFYFLDHVNIIRDIDALKGALDKITEQEND